MVSRISSMRVAVAVGGVQNRLRRTRAVAFSASSTLSSTVWFSNTVGFWNLRPMPSWAMAASSCVVRSTLPLSNSTSPVVGPGLAGDDVHHRGLAGAVRADDGAHLAGGELERQVVRARKPSKLTLHAVEIEQALRRSRAACAAMAGGPWRSLRRLGGARRCRRRRWRWLRGRALRQQAQDALRQEERDQHEQGAEREQPVGRQRAGGEGRSWRS